MQLLILFFKSCIYNLNSSFIYQNEIIYLLVLHKHKIKFFKTLLIVGESLFYYVE